MEGLYSRVVVALCAVVAVYAGCGPNHFLPFDKVVKECPENRDCALRCPFGLAKNSDDCEVCECQIHPCTHKGCKFPRKIEDYEVSCEEAGDCDRRAAHTKCPHITCQSKCQYALRRNSDGCQICSCNSSPCNNVTCPMGQRCVSDLFNCTEPPCEATAKCSKACPRLLECKKQCNETGFKRDQDDCRLCECKQEACDGVQCPVNQECVFDLGYTRLHRCACKGLQGCAKKCQYGHHRDINGCPLCQCVLDPCENVKCPGNLTCKAVQLNVCLHEPCPFKAQCVLP